MPACPGTLNPSFTPKCRPKSSSRFDRRVIAGPKSSKKFAEYLDLGVLVVCVLDPEPKAARLYRPGQPERILGPDDELDLSRLSARLPRPCPPVLRVTSKGREPWPDVRPGLVGDSGFHRRRGRSDFDDAIDQQRGSFAGDRSGDLRPEPASGSVEAGEDRGGIGRSG